MDWLARGGQDGLTPGLVQFAWTFARVIDHNVRSAQAFRRLVRAGVFACVYTKRASWLCWTPQLDTGCL